MSFITVPFALLMLFLYNLLGNYGLALIMFSFIIKAILFPFGMKSKKSSMAMGRLTPRVKELEKRYEGNKQKYNIEVQKLYKEENIKPMSGCLWSFIPLPILIALYSVVRNPLTKLMRLGESSVELIKTTLIGLGALTAETAETITEIPLTDLVTQHFDKIKEVVPEIIKIDFNFLGINLSQTASIGSIFSSEFWTAADLWGNIGLVLLPIISAVLSWLSMYIGIKINPYSSGDQSNKSMMLMMPLLTLYIGFIMPVGMTVYWIANSVFSIIQDVITTSYYKKKFAADDAEFLARQKARDEEYEKKRKETEALHEEGIYKKENTSKKKLQAMEKQRAEQAKREYEKRTESITDSQVGDRPYARGRAYVYDRFADQQPEEEDIIEEVDMIEEVVEVAEAAEENDIDELEDEKDFEEDDFEEEDFEEDDSDK